MLLQVKLVAFSAVSSVDDVGFDYNCFERFSRRNHSVGSARASDQRAFGSNERPKVGEVSFYTM